MPLTALGLHRWRKNPHISKAERQQRDQFTKYLLRSNQNQWWRRLAWLAACLNRVLRSQRLASWATRHSTLTRIPEIVLERGHFDRITGLPDGILADTLRLRAGHALTHLPDNLQTGLLSVTDSPNLARFPQHLQAKQIYIRDCDALQALDETRLYGLHTLNIANCQNISSLPNALELETLWISNAPNLSSLPANLNANKIYIDNCQNLRVIGSNTVVRTDLTLNRCPLSTIGQRLSVVQATTFRDCSELTAIPNDSKLGLHIKLLFCASLASLPENLFQFNRVVTADGLSLPRRVTLEGLALLHDPYWLRRLHNHRVQNQIFWTNHFWQNWLRNHREAHAANVFFDCRRPLASSATQPRLSSLLIRSAPSGPDNGLWQLEPVAQSYGLSVINASEQLWQTLSDANKVALNRFVEDLQETADFKSHIARKGLLERLGDILTAMHQNAHIKAICLDLMASAVTNCHDRVIFEFNNMELAIRSSQATQACTQTGSLGPLKDLGIGLIKLDVVNRHAARICETRTMFGEHVDPVEVYLQFHVDLRERLQLPISARHRLYSGAVCQVELEAAANDAQRAATNSDVQREFFARWEPWLSFNRRAQRTTARYADLREAQVSASDLNRRQCPFTLDFFANLKQPVATGEGASTQIYEFEKLMKWWVEHGSDPILLRPLALGDIYRISPSN